jgi:hypothetical protein
MLVNDWFWWLYVLRHKDELLAKPTQKNYVNDPFGRTKRLTALVKFGEEPGSRPRQRPPKETRKKEKERFIGFE